MHQSVIDEQTAAVRCRSCTAGKIEEWGVSGPIGCKDCDVCDGTGVVPAPQPIDDELDGLLWGWLAPAHVAIAEREARTGNIPAA